MKRTFLAVAGGLVLAVVGLLVWGSYSWGWGWTGIPPAFSPPKQGRDFRPEKTLWDWLQLLIVPAILAVWATWFSRRQTLRDQLDLQARNRDTEFELASQSQQDAVLATYLDRMSALLLDDTTRLRESPPEADVRTVARAWTLTSVVRLDGLRKRHIVLFLHESLLLMPDEPVVSLVGADLSRADLSGTILRHPILECSLDGWSDERGRGA